jgi:hypothetical protein
MRTSAGTLTDTRTWEGWLAGEHQKLDARLASVFMHTIWGAVPETRRELSAYRSALTTHLRRAERRFFAGLAGFDERTVAMERLEWKAHVHDLQGVLAGLERELRAASAALYDGFGTLRRALRRQRSHEARLMELVALPRQEEWALL